MLVPIVNGLRSGLLAKNRFPNFEISGDVGFAVLLPLDAGEQNEKVGGLAEDTPGRAGFKIVSAKVFVKTLQAGALGEVLALGRADSGQDIEVRGEPAGVLGEEAGDAPRGVGRAGPHQDL